MLISLLVAGVIAMTPRKPHQRPISEAVVLSLPWLFAMGAATGLGVFAWNLWDAATIRRQVREAARAANTLNFDFLNYRPLSLETASLAFPLLHPGGITEVHAVMEGCLDGQPIVVGYYEYEMGERDGPGSEVERAMATARGWMGKEVVMRWGQLVMMFPNPVQLPDLQISPRDDIDYCLLRYRTPVPLPAGENVGHYCVTSADPKALQRLPYSLFQMMREHRDWNVQVLHGRLMLWHGKLSVDSAEVTPGKCDRLVSDLRVARQWWTVLAREPIPRRYGF
jgi:hypothetical protein